MDGMILVFFLISILSSAAGSICGIGGGVIMKPVLDAAEIMSVSGISFLSGCTVLAMSIVSVYKNMHGKRVPLQLQTVVILAIGAAAGGVMGKVLFQMLKHVVGNENLVGMVQAVVLAVITLGTLLYTVCKRRIHTLQCRQSWIVFLIGLLLGILSSFLGIGGGPINIVVLEYFFSMRVKEAAPSSLFVIMFSQAAGLTQTLLSGSASTAGLSGCHDSGRYNRWHDWQPGQQKVGRTNGESPVCNADGNNCGNQYPQRCDILWRDVIF